MYLFIYLFFIKKLGCLKTLKKFVFANRKQRYTFFKDIQFYQTLNRIFKLHILKPENQINPCNHQFSNALKSIKTITSLIQNGRYYYYNYYIHILRTHFPRRRPSVLTLI